jgi:hypothetical protein
MEVLNQRDHSGAMHPRAKPNSDLGGVFFYQCGKWDLKGIVRQVKVPAFGANFDHSTVAKAHRVIAEGGCVKDQCLPMVPTAETLKDDKTLTEPLYKTFALQLKGPYASLKSGMRF